jgi:hypothetical protein
MSTRGLENRPSRGVGRREQARGDHGNPEALVAPCPQEAWKVLGGAFRRYVPARTDREVDPREPEGLEGVAQLARASIRGRCLEKKQIVPRKPGPGP